MLNYCYIVTQLSFSVSFSLLEKNLGMMHSVACHSAYHSAGHLDSCKGIWGDVGFPSFYAADLPSTELISISRALLRIHPHHVSTYEYVDITEASWAQERLESCNVLYIENS